MEHELSVLKGRLASIEMRLDNIAERSHAKPVEIVFEADGEPIEVFVTDENLQRLRRAVDKI